MTLTPEQQSALDALIAEMPDRNGKGRPPKEVAPPDWLETWTGIPASQVKAAVAALQGKKDDLEARFRGWTDANPLDASFEFLAASAWAFYQVEKGHNPKIDTYTDAFYYIATCASVGYADVFAVTQAGKAIAGMVMIVGPAITNKALEHPRRDRK